MTSGTRLFAFQRNGEVKKKPFRGGNLKGLEENEREVQALRTALLAADNHSARNEQLSGAIVMENINSVKQEDEIDISLDAESAALTAQTNAESDAHVEKKNAQIQEQKTAIRDSKASDAARRAKLKSHWAEGWYYILSKDRVSQAHSKSTYSKQGFKAAFAMNVPKSDSGKPGDPWLYVEKGVGFKTVDSVSYAVGFPECYEYRGVSFLNSFNPDSIPKADPQWTEEGRAAVKVIRDHIRLLTDGDEELAWMLESWIALNVRHPGKIIGCAPLIKGTEGDGKTMIFGNMMEALMGGENAGTVINEETSSAFTSWAAGSAYRSFEEIRASGKNRHEIVNKLKPYITNPTVKIIGKGKDGIDAPNTCNFAALTNHEDALPLKDNDRRWFVVFSPFKHSNEVSARVGMSHRDYFARLLDAVTNHVGQVRKFFEECEIHASVYHGMRAPETKAKTAMIKAEQDSLGGDYFESYLDVEPGVAANAISTICIGHALNRDMGRDAPRTRQLSKLLEAKGYSKLDGKVDWRKSKHTVYVKDAWFDSLEKMSIDKRNEVIRGLFEKTMPEGTHNGVKPTENAEHLGF